MKRFGQWLLFNLIFALFFSLLSCETSKVHEKKLKDANFHYQLASNHFSASQVPQALRELDITLNLNPNHVQALHLMGFIYMGRRQYLKAIKYFKQALEIKPDFYICKNNLGVAYLYLERWEEAAEIFRSLINSTLYTSPWLAYGNLGWALYKMGKLDKAIEETEMALFLNPKMCLASNNLGIMKQDKGLWEDAQKAFEHAIQDCPNYAEPHLHLGQLLASQGHIDEAKKHFERCIVLSGRTAIGDRCQEYAQYLQ